MSADFLGERVFHDPAVGPILIVFAIGVPLAAAMHVLAMATTGFGGVGYMVATIHVIQPLVNLGLIGVAASIGLGLVGVSAAWSASFGAALAVVFLFLRRLTRHIDPAIRPLRATGQLTRFSLPLMTGELLWVLMLWTDILMLGYFRSSAEVGIYRAAAQSAVLLALVPFSLDSMLAPMIAGLHTAGERGRLAGLFRTSTRWSFTASVPLVLAIALAAPDFLRLYGPSFPDASLPLLVLAAGQLVNGATGSVASMLVMTGRQYMKLAGDLLVAVTNITLNILLIPRWGLLGAAVATSVSVAGTNLLRLMQVWIAMRVQPYDRSYLKPAVAAVGAGAAGLGAAFVLAEFHFLIDLFGTAGVVLVSFVGLLWLLGFESEDRDLLWSALGRARLVPRKGVV